jgi:hypothetical protein
MPLARRSVSERTASDQLERCLEALVASPVDAGRGEDLESLPVRTDGRMQADPSGVGVRQISLSIRTSTEPTTQPAHIGTPRPLGDGECRDHCLGGLAGVLKKPGAVLQALLRGT